MTIFDGPMFQQGPSTGEIQTTAAKPKTEKRTTRKDLDALLAQFQPKTGVAQTKAEKERERLIALAESGVRSFSEQLVKLRILDGDLPKAEAALKALLQVAKNATAAIAGITDAKLDPQEKPAAKVKPTVVQEPAATKPVVEEPAATVPASQPGEDPREQNGVAAAAEDDETGF